MAHRASNITEHTEGRVDRKADLRVYSYKTSRHDHKTFGQPPADDAVKTIETNLIAKQESRFRLSAFRSLGASQTRRNAEQYGRSNYQMAISKWRKAQRFPDVGIDDHLLLQRRHLADVTPEKQRRSERIPVFPLRGSLLHGPDRSVPLQHRVRRTVVFRNDAPDVINIVPREPTIHFGERVVRSDVTRRNRVYPLPGVARYPRPKSILKTGQWSSGGNADTCPVRYTPESRQSYTPCRIEQDQNFDMYKSDSVSTIGSDTYEKSERKHSSPDCWTQRTPEISRLRLPVISCRPSKIKSYSKHRTGSTSSEDSPRSDSHRFACSNEFASALHTLDNNDVFCRNSHV